jgi:hypothetical protein
MDISPKIFSPPDLERAVATVEENGQKKKPVSFNPPVERQNFVGLV